jgi:hypothetical protein
MTVVLQSRLRGGSVVQRCGPRRVDRLPLSIRFVCEIRHAGCAPSSFASTPSVLRFFNIPSRRRSRSLRRCRCSPSRAPDAHPHHARSGECGLAGLADVPVIMHVLHALRHLREMFLRVTVHVLVLITPCFGGAPIPHRLSASIARLRISLQIKKREPHSLRLQASLTIVKRERGKTHLANILAPLHRKCPRAD